MRELLGGAAKKKTSPHILSTFSVDQPDSNAQQILLNLSQLFFYYNEDKNRTNKKLLRIKTQCLTCGSS